jgi:hypothetical protein
MVVLEVPQEGSKATTDSDRSTWRKLLHELESEAEIVDATINSHELKRANCNSGAGLTKSTLLVSTLLVTCCFL